MKLLRKVTLILMLVLLTLTLVACGPKPDETVKNFFDAVKKADFNTMSTYVKKDANKDKFTFEDANQEKIIKSTFSKVSYEIVSSKIDGNNATVKAKVTSLDLPRIYGKVVSETLPTLMAAAFANKADDAKSQLMQSFMNALNDPNASKTTTDIDIKLVKGDKGWLIEPTDDLLGALTGNINKAFNNSQNGNSSVKPDSKLYDINEEAKIGRASFTVTKFELSEGKDFDKPKEGYVFAVVTVKKKNISNDTLSYSESHFKIQTDKGQIIEPSISSIGKRLDSGKVAGGGEVEGTITFEVPKENASLTFMYYPESEALLKFKLK
ncbi:DUF4352 domain-containing protein [Clostridium sp. DJ247]|uniref:DUF4352 domain-containing protein n=1 Tax=Clostridium sp. DJ247 TaxID=2726188 RepID=UPI0016247CFC|nr:DUF4352 domain-containing protein [Clostridium sp. DJ247]MBC2579677.1 DUF4352 domain-containing protein [Clostridium sp. DJ247]